MATLDAKRAESSLEQCLASVDSSITALETTVEYLTQDGIDSENSALPQQRSQDDSESSKQIMNSLFGKFDDAAEQCQQLTTLCSMTTLEKLVTGGAAIVEENNRLLAHFESIAVERVPEYPVFREVTYTNEPSMSKEQLQLQDNGKPKSGSFVGDATYFPTPSKAAIGSKRTSSAITPTRAKAAALASPADSNPPTPSLDDFGLSLNTVNLLQK